MAASMHNMVTRAKQRSAESGASARTLPRRSRNTVKFREDSCDCREKDGCGDDCENRCMQIECDETNCSAPTGCKNRCFASLENTGNGQIQKFRTENGRGYGIRSIDPVEPKKLILEFTGKENISAKECARRIMHDCAGNKNHYIIELNNNEFIDATNGGSNARFINHSCQPNCEMQTWVVSEKHRMGVFTLKSIKRGEELTIDYNYNPIFPHHIQRCSCGSGSNCLGWLMNGADATMKHLEELAADHNFNKAFPKRIQRCLCGTGNCRKWLIPSSWDEDLD